MAEFIIPRWPSPELPIWNLHTNPLNEICIPFSQFVKPRQSQNASSATCTFPQFGRLPAEMQLHILDFCDAPTLFQLMHVSAALCMEAKKLFWAQPDAWYNVDSNWVEKGCYPGAMPHAMDIMAHVEQVELNFQYVFIVADADWNQQDRGPLGRLQLLHDFWKTLRARFPRVTRVVMSESLLDERPEDALVHLKRLAEMCPASISVWISHLRAVDSDQGPLIYSRQCERSLLRPIRVNHDDEGKAGVIWETTDPVWTRQIISFPRRRFSGPVGTFCRPKYEALLGESRKQAARLFLLEEIERHHFEDQNEPFTCPDAQCSDGIKLPGQWVPHALRTGHLPNIPYDCYKDIARFKVFSREFAHLQATLHDTMNKSREALAQLRRDRGAPDTEQQLMADQAFTHQLEHNPLYALGKPATETQIWYNYCAYMSRKYEAEKQPSDDAT